ETVSHLQKALADGTTVERQQAVDLLAQLKNSPEARSTIASLVEQLADGSLPPELRLEVMEAAEALHEDALTALVVRYQASKPPDDPLAPYLETLQGGDSVEGEAIFRGSIT